jgi:hypothetical protein
VHQSQITHGVSIRSTSGRAESLPNRCDKAHRAILGSMKRVQPRLHPRRTLRTAKYECCRQPWLDTIQFVIMTSSIVSGPERRFSASVTRSPSALLGIRIVTMAIVVDSGSVVLDTVILSSPLRRVSRARCSATVLRVRRGRFKRPSRSWHDRVFPNFTLAHPQTKNTDRAKSAQTPRSHR